MNYLKWSSFFLLILIMSCNTSKITTSWKDSTLNIEQYKKILVLGLIKENDRSLQENMENHFIGDLKNLGYMSISSLKEYGPKVFSKMDEETALSTLQNSGVDAVLTIVLLDKKKERKYVPSNPIRFWSHSRAFYDRIYMPGYYVTDTEYFWESNFYDLKTQRLLYSVQTTSFDPSNKETMAHEYGKMIVKNMVKQKILQQQVAL
jgi:hypothetical protein